MLCFHFFFLTHNSKEIALLQGQASLLILFSCQIVKEKYRILDFVCVPYFKETQIGYHALETDIAGKKMSYHDLGHKTSGWGKDFPCEYDVHY